MNVQNGKKEVFIALLWKFLERGGSQFVQFIVQIVLARMLLPENYGLIAIVTIFVSLANVCIQSGFATSLIQKKKVDNVDFSTVFCMNMITSLLFYIVLYFSAPFIADFYGNDLLIALIRIISLTIFFGAYNSIQNSYVSRTLQFKKTFTSSLIAMIISGTLGVAMALMGYGIWALVGQQLSYHSINTIILVLILKWKPSFYFSSVRAKELFSFGWKILVANLIDTLYKNLSGLIIGRIYTPITLSYFNRGKQFPDMIVTNINGSIQSVILPVLSSNQENKKKIKQITRRAIVSSTFLVFPMMVGLAVISRPLILLVLTEKWIDCVPFLQIYCFIYALWPIHTANIQAINAIGRSDLYLRIEIIKKLIGLIILAVSVIWGVYAIAIGVLISGILNMFINAYPNSKLVDYSYKEQIRDVLPSLLLSITMGGVTLPITFLNFSPILTIILQVLIGVTTYLGLAIMFKVECLSYFFKNVTRNE